MPKTSYKKRKLLIYAVLSAVAFLFLSSPRALDLVKDISVSVFSLPLDAADTFVRYLETNKELKEENAVLRRELGELQLEMQTYSELNQENERLRDLLKFKKRAGYETVSAQVIARDPNDWLGSFTINKGISDGVLKGSAVCSSLGLLGRVAEAGNNYSSVMLVTHPGFRAGGMLADKRVHGIVEGEGKGYARMLYLPVDVEVNPGDLVVTSGLSKIFPKGIIIGKVVSIEKSGTGLFKNALIKPEANAYDQEEVLCLK